MLGWKPRVDFAELVAMMVDADLALLGGDLDGSHSAVTAVRHDRSPSWPAGVGAARFLAGLVQVVPADGSCVDRQHRRRPRAPRPPHQPRPRHRHLHAGRRDQPGDRLGPGGRDVAGDGRRSSATAATTWFRLGDRDLATHLYRTRPARRGRRPGHGHRRDRRGVGPRRPPAAGDRRPAAHDGHRRRRGRDRLPGVLRRPPARRCRSSAVRFDGADAADAGAGRARRHRRRRRRGHRAVEPDRVDRSDARRARRARRGRRPGATATVAVSPIVAGAALKGPADRLLAELGHEPSVVGVARLYARAGGHARDRRGRRRRWPRRSRPRACAASSRRRSCPDPPSAAALARVVLEAVADDRLEIIADRGHPRGPARRRPRRPHRRRRAGRWTACATATSWSSPRRSCRRPRAGWSPIDPDDPRSHKRAGRVGVGADPAPPGRPHHQRDQARLRLRQRRHRPVQRRARLGRAAARRLRPLGPPHPRRHPGPGRRRGRRHRQRHVRARRGAGASPTWPSAAPASPPSSTSGARSTPSAASCRSPRWRWPTSWPPPPSW